MIKLLVLDKNEKLNIDNNKATFSEIAEKLDEEYEEFKEALKECDEDHITEEILDVLQCIIGLGDKIPDIERGIKIHNAKLKGRGWEFKKAYEIRQI